MKINYVAVGIFVVLGLVLFSVGLFLIGDHEKAFSHHVDFYTDLASVNGIAPGSKVSVAGFDAGQVEAIFLPDRPSGNFRIKLHLDDKLERLIRKDSVVTVESDGLVGDKFLLIHSGTDQSQQVESGATIPGKDPIELSAMLTKASGIMDQASGTIDELQGKLNVALTSATETIDNVNGLVTDVRRGKGAVGVLLNDQKTALELKQTVTNAQTASRNINQITLQASQMVTDVQSRNLPAKIDSTLTDVHSTVTDAQVAVDQLKQASKQVNATLNDALGPDRSGETAGENIRESLSNVTLATANVADDTEALKHGFLFRGYFKNRGFYSLQDLSPEDYRKSSYFQRTANHRWWLGASSIFARDDRGIEVLTAPGLQQLDQIIGDLKEEVADQPIVVEGYSSEASPSDQMIRSRSRALIVAHYLEKRYHLRVQDVGVMPLNATPPATSGKTIWDGVAVVVIEERRH